MSRRGYLAGAVGAGVALLAGCSQGNDDNGGGGGGGGADSMTIFHAGSLSATFEDAQSKFEDENGVTVKREAAGSVSSMKKITNQGRKADVLGVSDFRLLRDDFLPDYANWYSVFTTNAMAIAYTKDSTGADEIGTDNWWEILARDDVTFAHSDPAADPNGYRSEMAMQLGKTPFEGERLYDDSTYQTLTDKAKVPTGTETDLIAQLHSGKLDYAWEYKSAGASHDVEVLDLQPAVDLSKATSKYADHYAKAEVHAGDNKYTGAPIAYGITVPSNAEHPDLGAKWVEFMVSAEGRSIVKDNGLQPVNPAIVPQAHKGKVPGGVMSHAEAKSALGPIQL
ncbi:MAG: extracellular solute-binding protein [Haloarculaceae archaeon]